MKISLRQSSVTLALSVSLLIAPFLASAQTSTLLHDGDKVMGTSNLNIRSTPGTNGTVIGQLPSSSSAISLGTIRCDLSGSATCPTIANGYYWWYIDWDSSTLPSGWSAEGNSGDLYITNASLLELYTDVYNIYSGGTWTTPEDLSQALIDIYSSNETTASQANLVIQTTLYLISQTTAAFTGPITGIFITELLNFLLAPDLSSGYWNNAIKGALYSNATAGVETANLVLDLLNAAGLANIPTDFLLGQVAPITNSIMPYYATAQGGVGAIKASNTVTGGYGSPEEYTANFTRAQQGLTALVNNLLNRGVPYEDFGRTPVSGQWAWETMDLANPLGDFYYRGAAKSDAEASTLMNAVILNCYGPPEWTPGSAFSEPTAYIAATNGEPYPAPPAGFIPTALFDTAIGSGQIEGAQAENLITNMYGGAFWTAFARMGVGGQTMQNLIQQNFDPWVDIRTWTPDNIILFVAEKLGYEQWTAQDILDSLTPIGCTIPSSPQYVASSKFIIGDRVQVTANLNVRQTSSINGVLLGTQPTGAYGVITGGPKAADGYNWWTVNFEFPSDGWSVENYLVKAPALPATPPPTITPPPPPPPLSTKFIIGDHIQTTATVNVRVTPSINGAILGSQVTGALGTVIGGSVTADGYNWWNINYDTAPDGWSVEDFLVKDTSSPPSPPITTNNSTCGALSAPNTLTVGQNFSASVTMNNTGTKAWSSPQYWLSAVTSSGNWIDRWIAGGGLDLPSSPVNSGQSVTFTMNATAPSTAGPYNFSWQMLQEGIEFFGPVCTKNITVTSTTASVNNAQFISQTVPATMTAGQSYPVSITMKNTGTKNWSLIGPQVDAYRLRSENPEDNYIWDTDGRAELSAPVNVGIQTTINFTVRAPATAGTHNFQWRMVQEGVEEFGDFTANVPMVVSGVAVVNNSSCGTISAPSTVTPGQVFSASVTMNNTGTKAWSSPQYWLSAVTSSGNWIDRWAPGGGLDLPSSPVNSGQSVTFTMNATAPSTAGTHNFSWQMLQEGIEFFGPVCTKSITVSGTNVAVATVHYRATLNGAPWSGAIHFISVGTNTPTPWDGTLTFPADVPNAPSGITWTETYVSGGPTGATLKDITPSATQSITSGDITFTFNFTSVTTSGAGVPCIFSVSCDQGLSCQFTPTTALPYLSTCQPISSNSSPKNLASVFAALINALEQMKLLLLMPPAGIGPTSFP